MIKHSIVFFLSVMTLSAFSQVKTVKVPELQKVMNDPSNDINVINFWATWCGPCVKELPLFEKLHKERTDVAVTLVSMDLDLDPNPEKVYKFVARKKLTAQVVILDETDANVYIDQIEKEWSGALPATLIINTKTGKRKFLQQEVHEGDLEKLLDELQK